MKSKRLKDKLVLNKKTIINLTLKNMIEVKGQGEQGSGGSHDKGPAGASCLPGCQGWP